MQNASVQHSMGALYDESILGPLLTRVVKQDTVYRGRVWALQKEQNWLCKVEKRSGVISGETLEI